jgi:hypothetical protein
LHRRSFAPVLSLLSGTASDDEWDAEMEWIPDLEADGEIELTVERRAP